jgi:hypothetical protein
MRKKWGSSLFSMRDIVVFGNSIKHSTRWFGIAWSPGCILLTGAAFGKLLRVNTSIEA